MRNLLSWRICLIAELLLAEGPLADLHTYSTCPSFFMVKASGMFRGRDVAQS